jgi:hypothetical protein
MPRCTITCRRLRPLLRTAARYNLTEPRDSVGIPARVDGVMLAQKAECFLRLTLYQQLHSQTERTLTTEQLIPIPRFARQDYVMSGVDRLARYEMLCASPHEGRLGPTKPNPAQSNRLRPFSGIEAGRDDSSRPKRSRQAGLPRRQAGAAGSRGKQGEQLLLLLVPVS